MSDPRQERPKKKLRPANENKRGLNLLGVELRFPQDLPVQLIEVEVFAQLLESVVIPANDNEDNS